MKVAAEAAGGTVTGGETEPGFPALLTGGDSPHPFRLPPARRIELDHRYAIPGKFPDDVVETPPWDPCAVHGARQDLLTSIGTAITGGAGFPALSLQPVASPIS